MVGTVFAAREHELRRRLVGSRLTLDTAADEGWVVGTPSMWIEQLGALVEAGAQRIMLQWLDQDNIADLEIVARDVLPALLSA
jgi:hypothetical protein